MKIEAAATTMTIVARLAMAQNAARVAISRLNREGGWIPARPPVTRVRRDLFQVSKLSP